MEGVFKEVIIKEVSEFGGVDKVFIVENLPKKFLVQEVAEKKNVRIGKGDVEEVPTGKMIEVPLARIERNAKDGSFVFFTEYNEARERLADIDRYIETSTPRDQRVPKRVPNSTDLSSTRAYPLQKEEMPRVSLPLLVASTESSPRAAEAVVVQQATVDIEAIKAQAIAEYEAKKKEENRARMAAVRASSKK